MRFLVLSKFISSLGEVTWKPESLFRKLEEARRYIEEEIRGTGLPSGLTNLDFRIRKLTRKDREERRKYRKQGLT